MTGLAAIWLLLAAARTAAFLMVAGTGWQNAVLPAYARFGLGAEGAVAVLPVAVLLCIGCYLTRTKRRAPYGIVIALAGYAVVGAVSFLYVASWASFVIARQFLDTRILDFFATDISQNIAYTADLYPRMLVYVPTLTIACTLTVVWAYAWTTRPTVRHSVVRAAGAALFLLLVLVTGATSLRVRAARALILDPESGFRDNLSTLYSPVRRDRTGPVEYFAASMLDAIRGTEISRPSVRYPVVYPPVLPLAQYATAIAPKRLNVIVILLESVRADHLTAYGYGREAAPSIAAFAGESRVFLHSYTTATHTEYAAPSILSSQYPMRSVETFHYPKDIPFPHVFLYDILKREGYRTGFFSSDDENWGGKLNYWHTATVDHFLHAETYGGPLYGFREWSAVRRAGVIEDSLTLGEAAKWIDSASATPFFAYIALQNTHVPYRRPTNFPARFGSGSVSFPMRFAGIPKDSIQAVIDMYDNSLAYDDSLLGNLFRHLRARSDLWENTVVVLAADHGEAFNEHGVALHGTALFNEVLRVPIIVHSPGLRPGTDSTPASLVDVAPTVLGLLGLPPHPAFQGRDLFDETPDSERPEFAVVQTGLADQYAVILDGWKLIYDRTAAHYLLFDEATDPLEKHDLSGVKPAKRDSMAEVLQGWRWAQLHYYGTPELRSRYYAPQISNRFLANRPTRR